ncbi:TonB-dependent siderophore receptor [Pseudoduganella albidiflava]|uniref:TonB-dependent receptor n=1 Tax=Pseudoduganella albidiflava TaxID=321983 RepID=A0ABX5RQB1_9BURK|nr:TonB-dependent receptor [Pseudoduganella albidiflava]QBI00779.1 TonB-dependent receptor [Pseudoduganella albidiflava]
MNSRKNTKYAAARTGIPLSARSSALQRTTLSVAIRYAAALLPAAALAPAAQAQAAAGAVVHHDIPAGPLGQVLSRFAASAGVALSFDARLLEGRTSDGLRGSFSVSDGFARLLRGSGLEAQRLASGGYTLRAVAPASASDAPIGVAVTELPAIEITAQRTSSTLMRPTRQSTRLEREEVDELRHASDSLATVLGKAVPGMADSSRTITDYGQTLRGRNTLVLVDGIPLNTNRDSARNMAALNLASIDSVEVLNGSTAIYGAGASGGIIAITTRPAGGAPHAESAVVVRSSLSRPRADGLGGEISHYLAGSSGAVDYAFNAALQHIGASYDGKSRRIAPEPSQGDLFDSENYTVGGKIGFRIDRDRRVQLAASRYVAGQDSEYASDPSVARLPAGTTVARPIGGLRLDHQNQLRNTLVNASYQHRNFAGSTLSAQLYYRDYFTRFTPFDARAVSTRGNNVDQVMQNSTVWGGRATFDTPLASNLKLLWGLDFNQERSDMPDDFFNAAVYDASGGVVFEPVRSVMYMPPLTTRSIGAFGQAQYKVNQAWALEGGLRYEHARASFDGFVPLSQIRAANPAQVKGGTLSYDAWVSNVGATFKPVRGQELYASFSQGFQLPDMGLQVRNATPAFNLASSALEPVKTNNYELGWRGGAGELQGTLALFYTTSKLGDVQSFNNGLVLTRTAEKIRGLEARADYLPQAAPWGYGATLTLMSGRETPQGSVHDQTMTGYRIPPAKVTAYAQYKPGSRWSSRLQATYFGARDSRLNGVASFGRREVSSYTTLDLVGRYQVTAQGTVTIGVENLLNRYYLPAYSQLMRNSNNTSRLPAPGANVNVSYRHRW